MKKILIFFAGVGTAFLAQAGYKRNETFKHAVDSTASLVMRAANSAKEKADECKDTIKDKVRKMVS